MHNAAAAKSSAVLYTQLSFILHSCAHSAWQYTLNATQPSMNLQTVPSRHYRARTPAHRFLTRTTKYLLTHTMTHCSTYSTPDLPPTLAARLALCKGIHSNKYRHSNPPKQLAAYHFSSFLNKTHTQKPTASSHAFHTILQSLSLPHRPLNAQRCSC